MRRHSPLLFSLTGLALLSCAPAAPSAQSPTAAAATSPTSADVQRPAPSAAVAPVGTAVAGALFTPATNVAMATGGREGADESLLDMSVSPCDDFYQFACGTWMKNTPIPDDQSSWYRSFSVIEEQNETALKDTLEAYAKKPGATPYAKKIGDFYASCMDEGAIEKDGTKSLKPELTRIAAIKDAKGLTEEIAHLHAVGIDAAFHFGSVVDKKSSLSVIAGLQQGGLGLPDRDYYFNDDDSSKEIRKKYEAHVAKMFVLLGDTPAEAKAHASTVITMETKLAKASMTPVELRDPDKTYHKIDLVGLVEKAPSLPWKSYLLTLGAPGIKEIDVEQPDFIVAVNEMVKTTAIADWQTYLRWHLVHGLASTLSKAFVDEDFVLEQALTGAKVILPRWKRCTHVVDQLMGEALAIPFVMHHLGEDGKQTARTMVAGIEREMQEDIDKLPWMDDATRAKAKEKLSLIANMIGYPDKWRSYDNLTITRGSFATNVLAATAFETRRDLAKVGKTKDKSEWYMSPPTVNAYYSGSENNIVFPAGILQRPFYGNKMLDSVNYGAIGLVVGHELTHGFDDEGRKFDGEGNLKMWWTPAVSAEFEKRASCVSDQYSTYVAIDDVHVNGALTLGENIADLGGAKLSYRAFKKAHPANERTGQFTDEQQYFLGFAQAWCANIRPESVRMHAQVDPHSPARYRVNGPLSNLPEFASAFSCKAGNKMVRAEEMRCQVW